MQALLQPYNPNWPLQFEQLQAVLGEALQQFEPAIIHVGSTAVPGLAAKPIIDVDVVYTNAGDFARIKNALERLGYWHAGDQGIAGREVFKRHEKAHPVLDFIAHHLYVNTRQSAEWQRHVAFRDHLRKHAPARLQYEQLKKDLAALSGEDRKVYARLKETEARTFVEMILTEARQHTLQ